MELISYADLARLAGYAEPDAAAPHVSLFAPMVVRGAQTAQNPIRWVNQLRRAERELRSGAVPVEQIDALIGPGYLLADDRAFWEHQRGGLAYFATPRWSTRWRVPIELPDLVAVGPRFVVAPLLEVLTAGGTFWVLALDRRQVRLFEATRFRIDEPLPDRLPANVAELVGAGSGPGRPDAFAAGSGGAVYFGRGTPPDRARSAELARYFREVDTALRRAADGSAPPPLLLAGELSLLPVYRKVSSYPNLLDAALPGNLAERPLAELHASAWRRIEPVLRADEDAAIDAFRGRTGTGTTATDPDAVLEAARHGRVETLLVSTAVAGSAAGPAGTLRLGPGPSPLADRVDQAVAACLARAGTVHALAPERMPVAGPVAAILRY